jgi:hypothetical protein
VDVVQRVLEELTAPEQEIVVEIKDQMARFKRLRQLSRDYVRIPEKHISGVGRL